MLRPMIAIRRANQRGRTKIDWLDSRHTFSFGDYYDPKAMGFRVLRVLNDDRVAPGAGFPTHGHRDMEIVTIVLEGALAHKDSIGTGSVIRAGDVQRMTAGTGVRHSEFNASRTEPVHFLQIWILPEREGIEPGYEQKATTDAEKRGRFRLIASRDGREGSVTIHQDAEICVTLLGSGDQAHRTLAPGRHGYLHVARGDVTVGAHDLSEGDGVAISEDASFDVDVKGRSSADAEVLFFDLP
jgi:redox-sensitive bicupin YhaK (pirin superfamily)